MAYTHLSGNWRSSTRKWVHSLYTSEYPKWLNHLILLPMLYAPYFCFFFYDQFLLSFPMNFNSISTFLYHLFSYYHHLHPFHLFLLKIVLEIVKCLLIHKFLQVGFDLSAQFHYQLNVDVYSQSLRSLWSRPLCYVLELARIKLNFYFVSNSSIQNLEHNIRKLVSRLNFSYKIECVEFASFSQYLTSWYQF